MDGPNVQLAEVPANKSGAGDTQRQCVASNAVGGMSHDGGKRKKDHFVKRLYRQNLSGYVPIPRPRFAIAFFLSVGTLLLGLGIALYITALNVQQEVVRYDDEGTTVPGGADLANLSNEQRLNAMYTTNGEGWKYTLPLTVQNDLKAPVYVYYRLGNYYQNYRRYINSANWNQVHGDNTTSLSACDPIRYVWYNQTAGERQPNDNFSNNGIINPCGLWAWSYFNDTYAFSMNGKNIDVQSNDLAWSWQRDKLFGSHSSQNFNGGTKDKEGKPYIATSGGGKIEGPLNQDDRFMVWMRPEAHYTFQKLWGVINQDLPAGSEIMLNITNRYNMYQFGGLKAVVLSENSWMGGRNLFLGILMIVVGCLYYLAALFFLAGRLLFNRPLGDERFLSWHRVQARKGFVQGFKEFVKR